jgi:GT2 family glycosyltransferase
LLEKIVIDNGSEKSLELTADNIKLIRLDENTGFTGGYNTGIKKALEGGADYVLIVNNDTILDQNLIVELQQALEEDRNRGVAVPKIYFAPGYEFHKERYKKEELGKVFWYAGGFIDWDNVHSVHRGVDEVDHGQYDTAEKVTFATGCCMMLKKEVFEKVGFFDERYFLYFEDADMNVRVSKHGYSTIFVPSATLFHMNASSSGGAGKGNTLQDYFITRNQMLFGMMYAPFKTKIALIKQSFRFLTNGRDMQKKAIKDYYLGKFGKGTFFDK